MNYGFFIEAPYVEEFFFCFISDEQIFESSFFSVVSLLLEILMFVTHSINDQYINLFRNPSRNGSALSHKNSEVNTSAKNWKTFKISLYHGHILSPTRRHGAQNLKD